MYLLPTKHGLTLGWEDLAATIGQNLPTSTTISSSHSMQRTKLSMGVRLEVGVSGKQCMQSGYSNGWNLLIVGYSYDCEYFGGACLSRSIKLIYTDMRCSHCLENYRRGKVF